MSGRVATAVFCDPPYNLRVRAIGGRGRVQHPEFAFASGEMSRGAVSKRSSRKRWATACAFRLKARFISSAWIGATSAN